MTQTSTQPVTLDEVKALYGNVQNNASGVAVGRAGGRRLPLGLTPMLNFAYEKGGKVFAPIENEVFEMNRFDGVYVEFYAENSIVRSRLIMLSADPQAYVDPIKAVSFNKFTGRILVVDDEDYLKYMMNLRDGVPFQVSKPATPTQIGQNLFNRLLGLPLKAGQRSGSNGCFDDWGPGIKVRINNFFDDVVFAVKSGINWVVNGVSGWGTSGEGGGAGSDPDTWGNLPGGFHDTPGPNGWQIGSTNTGGGTATHPSIEFCNDLDNRLRDDNDLLSHYQSGGNEQNPKLVGMPTKATIEAIEHRERLRFLKDWFDCGTMYQMETIIGSQFSDCAYNFLKANPTSYQAQQQVKDIIAQVSSTTAPVDADIRRIISQRGCELLNEGCLGNVEACLKNMRIEDLKSRFPDMNNKIEGLLAERLSFDEINNIIQKYSNYLGTNPSPIMAWEDFKALEISRKGANIASPPRNIGPILDCSPFTQVCPTSFTLTNSNLTNGQSQLTCGLQGVQFSFIPRGGGTPQSGTLGNLYIFVPNVPPAVGTANQALANAISSAFNQFQTALNSGTPNPIIDGVILSNNEWILLLINQNLRAAWGWTPGSNPLGSIAPGSYLLDSGSPPDPQKDYMGNGRLGYSGTYGTVFNDPITGPPCP